MCMAPCARCDGRRNIYYGRKLLAELARADLAELSSSTQKWALLANCVLGDPDMPRLWPRSGRRCMLMASQCSTTRANEGRRGRKNPARGTHEKGRGRGLRKDRRCGGGEDERRLRCAVLHANDESRREAKVAGLHPARHPAGPLGGRALTLEGPVLWPRARWLGDEFNKVQPPTSPRSVPALAAGLMPSPSPSEDASPRQSLLQGRRIEDHGPLPSPDDVLGLSDREHCRPAFRGCSRAGAGSAAARPARSAATSLRVTAETDTACGGQSSPSVGAPQLGLAAPVG